MSEAQRLAASRALDDLGVPADRVLLDGKWDFVGDGTSRMLVKGDARCLSIAAASILAKVTRDRIMREEAEHHALWSFDENKGYPCPRHKMALRGVGPSAIHRRSWVFMDHLRVDAGCPASCRPSRSTRSTATSSACSDVTGRLPPPVVEQVRSTLRDLRAAQLAAHRLADGGRRAGPRSRPASTAATRRRSSHARCSRSRRSAYEGKVRSRLAGADRPRRDGHRHQADAARCPIVGAVCGVLVAGARLPARRRCPCSSAPRVFALFIFGVAVAGTRTNAERTEDRRARRASPTREVARTAARVPWSRRSGRSRPSSRASS